MPESRLVSAWPGDAPEYFIGASMERFQAVTGGRGVILRPWPQALGWRTKTYSPEYVRIQVSGAREKGRSGSSSGTLTMITPRRSWRRPPRWKLHAAMSKRRPRRGGTPRPRSCVTSHCPPGQAQADPYRSLRRRTPRRAKLARVFGLARPKCFGSFRLRPHIGLTRSTAVLPYA